MRKASPTFIAAAVVTGLSAFVILSMLFYGPSDYFERSDAVAEADGLRFSIASLFFTSFGIGAYVGWAIVLAWAVVVFFREAVGELAIRAVSLVVAVCAGAALADLLGGTHLGGHLGGAIGSVLQANFGTVFGVILIGAIFGISFMLATDFAFVSYYREARGALGVAEPEEEPGEDEPAPPMDLIARIEQAVREAEHEEEEGEEAREQAEVAIAAADIPEEEEEEGLLRLSLRPPIEEETLDEDLLTDAPRVDEEQGTTTLIGFAVTADEVETEEEQVVEPPPEVEPEEEEPAAEFEIEEILVTQAFEPPQEEEPEVPENVEREAEPIAAVRPEGASAGRPGSYATPLDAVFDALVGPRIEPSPEEVEALSVLIDDEIHIPGFTIPEPEPEDEDLPEEPEAGASDEEEPYEPRPILIDDVITFGEPSEEEPEPEEAPPELQEAPPELEEPAAEAEFLLVDNEIPIREEPAEREEMLPFMREEGEPREEVPVEVGPREEVPVEVGPREEVPVEVGPREDEIPVLTDVREEEPRKRGLRSLFSRKKGRTEQEPVAEDPLLDDAAKLVIERGRASVVLLQRRLDIGYTRASRLVDALEGLGLVGPLLESGSREILMTPDTWEELRG